ncbi:MAG: hypothetical protein WC554_12490, partial [Clostridia bacterium]
MIKRLSEVRRLPRLGHIRLGIKATAASGQEYPKEVDYFILDPKTPDPDWNDALVKKFAELYGPKPKAIKIMFPPADPQIFFPQFYKRYGATTLVKCKGDGEVATTAPEFAAGLEQIGEDERGFIQVKCLGPECPYQKGKNEFAKNKECSRMGLLQVILPELPGFGIWQINTGSYNSIVNMNSAIEWLESLCGRFAMIPITLMRVPTDIQYEGKRGKHWILQVDQQRFSIGDLQKIALTPAEKIALPAPDETKDTLFFLEGGKRPDEPEDAQTAGQGAHEGGENGAGAGTAAQPGEDGGKDTPEGGKP